MIVNRTWELRDTLPGDQALLKGFLNKENAEIHESKAQKFGYTWTYIGEYPVTVSEGAALYGSTRFCVVVKEAEFKQLGRLPEKEKAKGA